MVRSKPQTRGFLKKGPPIWRALSNVLWQRKGPNVRRLLDRGLHSKLLVPSAAWLPSGFAQRGEQAAKGEHEWVRGRCLGQGKNDPARIQPQRLRMLLEPH